MPWPRAVREMKNAALSMLTGSMPKRPTPPPTTSSAPYSTELLLSRSPAHHSRIHARRDPGVSTRPTFRGLASTVPPWAAWSSISPVVNCACGRCCHDQLNASATIIKEAVAEGAALLGHHPSGRQHVHHPSLCRLHRDLDYYRYATYAMLAGDTSILDERVLNGLKSLQLPGRADQATVQSVQAMKPRLPGGSGCWREMAVYFDYICSGLGS